MLASCRRHRRRCCCLQLLIDRAIASLFVVAMQIRKKAGGSSKLVPEIDGKKSSVYLIFRVTETFITATEGAIALLSASLFS